MSTRDYVTVVCNECGTQFKRLLKNTPKYNPKVRNSYCSRKCYKNARVRNSRLGVEGVVELMRKYNAIKMVRSKKAYCAVKDLSYEYGITTGDIARYHRRLSKDPDYRLLWSKIAGEVLPPP